MTSCPSNLKSQLQSPSTIPTLPSGPLLSLPPSAITNIFQALSPNSHKQHQHHPHHSSSSECNHAWIQPAFELAISNSYLYFLYCHAIYNPGLDSQHQQEFLTTDCEIHCFTTLLSGLSSLRLVRRATTPIFDAGFIVERCIPTTQQQPHSQTYLQTTCQTFAVQNSTLSITQIENLFAISKSFPSLHTLELSNVTSRDNTHLWSPITEAWSHSLESLSIEDAYSEFDEHCFAHFARFQNLERLVISSRAVSWIHPLQHLTSLNELVLHNCTIHDNQVIKILSNMAYLRVLDLTETCVTPNIVNSLPKSLIRFAGGDRDAHCGDEDRPAVVTGLSPIDVRQATLFEHSNPDDYSLFTASDISSHDRWRKNVIISPQKLPKLKFLEWGEWRGQRQSAASLRFIMPQLESLCLCGPDYGDELCDALLTSSRLKCLELYGCNITDATAHLLSQHPALEFVNITNCERVTPRGLLTICTGRAARNETLESVFILGQMQPPSDAIRDLLEDHRDMFSDADVNDLNDTDSDLVMDEQTEHDTLQLYRH